jgi:hypothetical protein
MGKLNEAAWKDLVKHLAGIEQLTEMQRLEILEKVDPDFQGAKAAGRQNARRALAQLEKAAGWRAPGVSL